ncbi:MAG: TetR/AcrR family transcriptional regulator [Solirubrobacteraceae bacterium]
MADPVKATRQYHSPRRREQAAATRRDILDAAQRLFERDGYPATTMSAIASEAQVALKTVYIAFETKSGVLRALWNLRLRDDRDELPVSEQPRYREVLEEPDPQRQLRLNARNSREGKLRVAALAEVVRSSAALEPDIGALWERINREYHANQRVIVESLADKGALRSGLTIERATDILWTLNHPNTWQLLVTRCHWTPEHYEQWVADTSREQLLSPASGSPRRRGRRAQRES